MSIWVIGILLFLLFDFVVVLFVFLKLKKKKTLGQKELNYIQSHWVRIIDSFSAHPKHAILDADKLLDYALGKHGFEGSLGEKLKKCGARFSDLNGVWSAHKLRNHVAHELGDIDKFKAKSALAQFKKALNDLGANL
jgi:hypothetical protein